MSFETYGPYQLLKRLATGGMAQIFLARHELLERFDALLVIKRILPHLAENDEFVRMFLAEARIAARLHHPNVVQILNVGAQDDSYFIAMEYIHGEDVRRVWRRASEHGRQFPVELACYLIMEACAGLDYAHRKTDNGRPLNIVHRDVSPQNLVIAFDGAVKVLDFGIAKAADQISETRSGVLKGKYAYMAPEQALAQKVDRRSDLFALGVVFFELLTQRRLFKRVNEMQTLAAVCECEVPVPSAVNGRVPAELDAIVLRALAKDVDDRYQWASELRADLAGWLASNGLAPAQEDLAAFMGQLYADKLAREAVEGRILVEELGLPDDPGPRVLPPLVPRGSWAPASEPPAEVERTVTGAIEPTVTGAVERTAGAPVRASADKRPAAAPTSAPSNPPKPRLALPDARSSAPRTPAALLDEPLSPLPRRSARLWAGLGALVVASVVATLVVRGSRGEVHATIEVSTQPAGATVLFDGETVGATTPCTLPPRKQGVYPLVLSLAGHQPLKAQLEVPARGSRSVSYTLQPEEGRSLAPRVLLTVRSEPTGAQVFLDGVPRGHAPLSAEVEPRRPLPVRLELPGYQPFETDVSIGDRAAQVVSFKLDPVTNLGQEALLVASTQKPVAKGRVQFVAPAPTQVSCGGVSLGRSPLGEVSLPEGEYDCRFNHPVLGTQFRKIVVRPNARSEVTVRF